MAEHNVEYFRGLVTSEKNSLTGYCRSWKAVLLDDSIPEDASGEIRTAIGLTELLLGEKIKQFEGLIDDCELKRGEKEVTCDDLQGFYDMIYFEVKKIHKKFNELDELKDNNWEIKSKTPIKIEKTKVKLQPTKKDSQPNPSTKSHILAARKRLAEAKANAMKMKNNQMKEQKENFTLEEVEAPSDSAVEKKEKDEIKAVDSNLQNKKKNLALQNKKPKEAIPLSCVTRSMKRALMEKNKGTL